MSGRKGHGDDVELNLMDELDDSAQNELEDHAVAEESAFAVQEFSKLPFATQEQVRGILRTNEKLQFVEKPSRWRSTSSHTTFSQPLTRATICFEAKTCHCLSMWASAEVFPNG